MRKALDNIKGPFMANAIREYLKPIVRREVWDNGRPAVPDKVETPRRIVLTHTGTVIGTAPSPVQHLDLYRVVPYLESSLRSDRQSEHHFLITLSGLTIEMQSGSVDAIREFRAPTVPSRPFGMGVYRVDIVLEGDILKTWPNREQEAALARLLALYGIVDIARRLRLPIYIDPALKPQKSAVADSLAASRDKLRDIVQRQVLRYLSYREIGNGQIIGTV